TAWFGTATPPVGFLYGFYGGAGVGLSQSTDAVNLFDSTGALMANVSFGATTVGKTFDNSQGLNNSAISQVSALGVNGAFTSSNGAEIGSPGNVVTISATDASASETGSDPGTFRIFRTGDMTNPLVVSYAIGGTATNGGVSADYTPTLTGTATIAAG